jgi:hypothetical protein
MVTIFRAFAVVVVLGICFLSVPYSFGQTRPAPNRPTNDFKVKYKVTMNMGGQPHATESVTMIKGARERSESSMGYGYDQVNITQCDLKRTIQINDKVKKYLITPMEIDTSTATSTPASTPEPRPATPSRSGGIVTYVTSSIDTGERREMFGFTARHVKSSTTIQSSPDACNPTNLRTEVDGWYIDLSVEFNCNLGGPATAGRPPTVGGCRDQVRSRREGNGKIGYPLIETMRMLDQSGNVTFATTKEVLELSRESLDVALFDIPAGYTQAMSQQEMYGAPSTADIMGNVTGGTTPSTSSTPTPSAAASGAKQPGAIRVGVVQINNKSGKPSVSADALRMRLIGEIKGAGVDAIPLNGTSAAELDAEAKAKQCDYILYSDLAALKMSKLGGLFGSVTGAGGIGKTESKMEYRLFAVGETSARLQSSSSAKEEGDENSAGVAIAAEARAVVTEVKKRRG